jgi:hypothetical protein
MSTNLELENVQPNNSGSASSEGNTITSLLKNVSSAMFLEGRSPHLMNKSSVSAVDAPKSTREDIENFVRATAPTEAIDKLNRISTKNREDYRTGQEDIFHYSISAPDYAYRCCYRMNRFGASLNIRRVPKLAASPVSPSNQLDLEAPTNQLIEP